MNTSKEQFKRNKNYKLTTEIFSFSSFLDFLDFFFLRAFSPFVRVSIVVVVST